MKTLLAKMLPTIGALVVLVSGAVLMSGPGVQGAPQTSDVRVVNTTAQPVPTLAIGTTAVAGEVTIGGTPGVTIVNGPRSPIPVEMRDPTIEAYQGSAQVVMFPYESTNNFSPGPIVPAGKRLVIEYVSARTQLPGSETLLEAGILTNLDGKWGPSHYLVPTSTASSGGWRYFSMSHPIRMYADADATMGPFGSPVRLSAKRSESVSGHGAVVQFTISGYLIDLP